MDQEDQFYYLSFPSLLEEFIVPEISEPSGEEFPNSKTKYAVYLETMEEIPLFYVDAKDSKKWSQKYQIWKSLCHPNYIGFHSQIKEGNNLIYLQDRKCISLPKLIYSTIKQEKNFHKNSTLKSMSLNNFRGYRFSEKLVKVIAMSIFSFISYLHQEGIVFGNFDLNHVVFDSAKNIYLNSSLEMSRNEVNTSIFFAAPEVIKDRTYNMNSDIWSIGVYLFILLYGYYPFDVTSEESLKISIVEKEVSPPTVNPINVSNDALKFIFKLLKKNSQERPSASNCLKDQWFFKETPEIIIEEQERNKLLDQILNSLKKLDSLKFKKLLRSKYSLVSDTLQERENRMILQSNRTRRKTNSKTSMSKTNTRILVIGPQNTGGRELVEKIITQYFKENLLNPEVTYINGSHKIVHNVKVENDNYKFIVVDTLEKNMDNYTKINNLITKKKVVQERSSEESSEKQEKLIEIGQSVIFNNKRSVKLENSLLRKSNKLFGSSQLFWDHEIINIGFLVFVADHAKFDNDKIDEITFNSFKTLMKTNYISNKLHLPGNLPMIIIINNIEKIERVNESKITFQFLKNLPVYNDSSLPHFIFSSNHLKDFQSLMKIIETNKDNLNSTKIISESFSQQLVLRKMISEKTLEHFRQISLRNLKKVEFIEFNENKTKFFENFFPNLKGSAVEQLYLIKGYLSEENVSLLTKAIESNENNLNCLKLIDQNLGQNEVFKIISSLSKNNKIKSIDLSKNYLNESTVEKLVNLALQRNYTEIFISNCGLVENDMNYLITHLLRLSNSLKSLDISGNTGGISTSSIFFMNLVKEVKNNHTIDLTNFVCSMDFLSKVIINQLNLMLAEKRKKVTRIHFTSSFFNKNKIFPINFPVLVPSSPLTRIIFLNIFQNDPVSTKLYQRAIERLTGKEPSEPKTERTIRFLGDHVFYFLQKDDSFLDQDHHKIDFSYFSLSDENLPKQFIDFQLLKSLNFDINAITIIDFSHNSLKNIPTCLYSIESLQELYLGCNFLTEISDQISKFSNLKILDMRNNLISHISPSLAEVEDLNALYLHQNRIYEIKTGIFSKLVNLEILTLHNNFIEQLPYDFFQLKTLKQLTISNNLISHFKVKIFEIWASRNKIANLSKMNFEHLSFRVGLLQNVTELDLKENKLKYLPPHISNLTNLKKLDLRYNLLAELPPQITAILNNLKTLHLYGNTKLHLPNEIEIEKDKPVSHSYYPVLTKFLEEKYLKTCQSNCIKVCLLAEGTTEIDNFFKNFLENCNKDTVINYSKNMTEETLEKFSELESYHYTNNIFQLKEIFDTEFEKKSFLKPNTKLSVNQVYRELEHEGVNIKFFCFENTILAHHFLKLFDENSAFVFVVITNIEEDLKNVLKNIQKIRYNNKGNIIVLGNNPNQYDKKKHKEIELLTTKKLSKIYKKISCTFFVLPQNSKNFLENLKKSSQENKISYQQFQLENMIISESTFYNVSPIVNYNFMKEMISGIEKKVKIGITSILEVNKTQGNLIYFNTSIWGKNNLVIIEPSFMINLLKQLFEFSQKKDGIFNVLDFYSEMSNNNSKFLFVFPHWISTFFNMFKKLEVIFNLEMSSSILKQYRKYLPNNTENHKNISLIFSDLPHSPYEWEILTDLCFSLSEPPQNQKNREIEIWHHIPFVTSSLNNTLLHKILKITNISILQIWKNMALFRIENNTFVLGFF